MGLLTVLKRVVPCGRHGLAAVSLMVCAALLGLGQTPIPEYRVKATFLFQFTQFIDWPPPAFRDPKAPLIIGILGPDPFGTFLDETVRDEKAKDHPLTVERYSRLEDVNGCQVLFVTEREAKRVREIAAALKSKNVLLVGDVERFADDGGMIQFVTQENKIRLRINLSAARAANLTISSNLLRLATVINSGGN